MRTSTDSQASATWVSRDLEILSSCPAWASKLTRMAPAASQILDDLNLDTVDYLPTYDERRTEPTVLPSRFPNLLVNGANGIAVGYTTSIPPHNLGEVCDALTAKFGARFETPALLREMAEKGQSFYGRFTETAKAA